MIVVFALAVAVLPWIVWDKEEKHVTGIVTELRSDNDSAVVILTVIDAEHTVVASEISDSSKDDAGLRSQLAVSCPNDRDQISLSLLELTSPALNLAPLLALPQKGQEMLDTMGAALASIGTGGIDFITYARRKIVPNFAASYRDLIRRVALMALARLQEEAAFAHSTIIGTVFTYNPFRVGKEEGGPQTASGEPYDPEAWTAAIKTDLRNQFRGVRYGRLYQPAFALVERGDKQLIVKINDVGPLRPGRVLDLNERSMRHFDPSMTRGLLDDVKITLLPGENWTPGPVSSTYAISLVPSRTVATQSKSVDSTGWQIDAEMRSGSSAGGSLHD
ncbi:MAG: septal ring lytic transglycosylase RlpA family protein [Pseudolabrys sp.]